MKELWKPIKDYEGIYSISNNGNVRRDLDRTSAKKGSIIKPYKNIWGYMQISLFKNGKRTNPTIHSLVMRNFVGERKHKMTIHHKDNNKENNNLSNLEYCTYSKNITLAFRDGIRPTKLTIYKAREIRAKYARGNVTQKELAIEYGVPSGHICLIIHNKKWKEI